MAVRPEKRSMTIVSACMRQDGLPAFALTEVQVSQEEVDNGVHFDLAEAQLLRQGYDEPFVHFPEQEAPPFLHDAVRRHLRQHLPVSSNALLVETR
jgi:hypothetical protein